MSGPTVNTIKRLFAVSGNRCAFPKCREPLIDNGILVGDLCHIKAANPKGPRYDPTQTEAERHAFENLILLCKKHHTIVDTDLRQYTASALMIMKKEHESKQDGWFAISDNLAIRLAIFGAGAAAPSVVGKFARTVRDIRETLSGLFPIKPKKTEIGVPQRLALFGPGQMAFYADNDLGKQLGNHFVNLFRKQGWQVTEMGPDRPDFIKQFDHPSLIILMSHKNRDMAFKAVAEVLDAMLEAAGFRLVSEGNWEKRKGLMFVMLTLV
jgi:hypothetical protein